jgi:hypothetical protein
MVKYTSKGGDKIKKGNKDKILAYFMRGKIIR